MATMQQPRVSGKPYTLTLRSVSVEAMQRLQTYFKTKSFTFASDSGSQTTFLLQFDETLTLRTFRTPETVEAAFQAWLESNEFRDQEFPRFGWNIHLLIGAGMYS